MRGNDRDAKAKQIQQTERCREEMKQAGEKWKWKHKEKKERKQRIVGRKTYKNITQMREKRLRTDAEGEEKTKERKREKRGREKKRKGEEWGAVV